MKEQRDILDRVDGLAVSEIEKFFSLPVWRCIEDDIKARYIQNQIMMEEAPADDVFGTDGNGNFVKFVSGVKRLQGENSMLRMFLEYKELLLKDKQMIEEEQDEQGPRE